MVARRGRAGRTGADAARAILVVAMAAFAASCSFAPKGISTDNGNEYFSEAQFGPASPRVVSAGAVPRGGGTYKVGRPYQVAGRTFVPQHDPDYVEVGTASWYGTAFHGRMTANGEVYDVSAWTAAHPTLPLPSYVRVTNLENGRSMVVRVNDRGPFADDRIIDVSAAVAAKLDFKGEGTAKVRVEYVGPARMDGRDQPTLLASYTESGPAQLPQGNRVPAEQTTPTVILASAPVPPPSPGRLPDEAFQPMPSSAAVLGPTFVPVGDPLGALIGRGGLVSSYAEAGSLNDAQQAIADLAGGSLGTALARAAALRAQEIGGPPVVVQVGSFSDRTNAVRASVTFDRFGPVEIVKAESNGRLIYVVQVASADPRAVVEAALDAGLPGAIVRQN